MGPQRKVPARNKKKVDHLPSRPEIRPRVGGRDANRSILPLVFASYTPRSANPSTASKGTASGSSGYQGNAAQPMEHVGRMSMAALARTVVGVATTVNIREAKGGSLIPV